jgi:hypothetical protein
VTLTTDTIVVFEHIHPLTTEAAIYVASHLRPDDYREVTEGHGVHPLQAAVRPLDSDDVYFTMPNGETAGMGGIEPDGRIWMLCTPIIHEYPITFARLAKNYLESRPEPFLWNIIDKRNTVHLKLLKWLGFKFLEEFEHGPNKLTFIKFYRGSTSSRTPFVWI